MIARGKKITSCFGESVRGNKLARFKTSRYVFKIYKKKTALISSSLVHIFSVLSCVLTVAHFLRFSRMTEFAPCPACGSRFMTMKSSRRLKQEEWC